MAAISISPPPSSSSSQDLPLFSQLSKILINQLKFSTTVEEIKRIHGQMIRTGILRIPPASSDLVSAYSTAATSESLNYAMRAFELVHEEQKDTLFLWNSLIRGFSSAGRLDKAIELLLHMVEDGLIPDRFTFPPILAGFTKALAFRAGSQLHGFLLKVGSNGGARDDIFTQNSLIHFYAEQGDLESAHKVFEEMPERNVVSWTSLIDGYARGSDPLMAVTLFNLMVSEGRVAPNSISVACVISACAKLKDLENGERIFSYAVDCGIVISSSLLNTLVDLYMKCGSVEIAERIFRDCGDRSVVLWNTMLSNYSRGGMARKAIALFDDMLLAGARPDRVTILAVASASAQLGEAAAGRRFHGYVLRNGLDAWHDATNSVIDVYMKCGEVDLAFRIFEQMAQKTAASWNTLIHGCIRNGDWTSAWKHFEEMPRRDRISWNTMIGALVQAGGFEAAISLFREMQSSGISPDGVTMVSVASACGYLAALDLAKWIYAYINKIKFDPDVKLNTALIDMFARCGDAKTSMKIFGGMPDKDVPAWTAAIGAMAAEGNGRRAIELFSEMIGDGLEPDGVVFAQVLTACSHGGLVDEGREFFRIMTEDYGLALHLVHYGCMVDLLGRAGLLGEARLFVESMTIEPNDVIWGALLAASTTHRDLEMAEYAAGKVLELAPRRSGIHALLSNAYASAGRWKDVAEVRMLLREKGGRKLPGCSLIEIEGVIHEFTSGDESHPRREMIADMMEEMGRRVSLAGHVPELDEALMDVGEEEKEVMLSRHGEKMAVAFGLISTGRGVPIRVVKNLRICADCHSFIKERKRLEAAQSHREEDHETLTSLSLSLHSFVNIYKVLI